MKSIYVLALVFVLLATASFAQSCISSGDCADDEYCSDGYCTPYSSGSTNYCCGPTAVVLAVGALGVFLATRKN